jgi:hypothetical protein
VKKLGSLYFYLHNALSWVSDFFDIKKVINMVHELNYQLLTCSNHYLGVAFFTYHNLLKHM